MSVHWSDVRTSSYHIVHYLSGVNCKEWISGSVPWVARLTGEADEYARRLPLVLILRGQSGDRSPHSWWLSYAHNMG